MRAGRYARVLTLFGLLRLLEVGYSVRNERRLRARDTGATPADPAGFRRMVAVNVALFSLPLLEARRRRRPAPRWMTRAGWIGQAAAIGLRLWVIASLRQAWTVTATVPSDLVVVDRGPYRFVRHPNYVAVALEFLALPLIGGAAVSAAVLSAANALVLRDRILAEERLLARVPDYLTRMGDRPRFVPRLRDLTGPRADGSSRAPRSDRIPSTRS